MKRGRPKAVRERYPSGQVRPQDAGVTWSSMQRLRSLGTNPLLETPLGRLLYLEEIRPIDWDTGQRIADIYRRFEQYVGMRRWVASPDHEIGRGRSPVFEDDAARERAEATMREFGALQAEIQLCPRGVRPALESLCVEERECPPGWLPAVKIALDMLALPLGLRRRKKT